MSDFDFYSNNGTISYPLVKNDGYPEHPMSGSSSLHNAFIVDAGFTGVRTDPDARLETVGISGTTVFAVVSINHLGSRRNITFSAQRTDTNKTVFVDDPAGIMFITFGEIGIAVEAMFKTSTSVTRALSPSVPFEPATQQCLSGDSVSEVRLYNRIQPNGPTQWRYTNVGTVQKSVGSLVFASGYNLLAAFRDGVMLRAAFNEGLGGTTTPMFPPQVRPGITSVNGVAPANGNINIAAGRGIEIENVPNQHKVVVKLSTRITRQSCR